MQGNDRLDNKIDVLIFLTQRATPYRMLPLTSLFLTYVHNLKVFKGLDFIMFDLLGLFIWITSFLQVQVIVWILLRSLEERYIRQNIVIFNLVAT